MKKEDDSHERARRLIDVEHVEGLAGEERRWLEGHLAACGECARWAARAEAALISLRSVSVALPPGLSALTKQRVREKAEGLRQHQARNLALLGACALSWLAGVASSPFVWKLCAWVGSRLDLPRIVWQLAFLFWWFVPAAAASVVILLAHAGSNYGLKFPESNGP